MTKKRRYSGQQKQPENSKKKNEKRTKNVSKGDGAGDNNNSPDHLSSTLSSALASCNSVLYGDILKDLHNPSDCDKMPKINENVDEPNDPEQNPPVSAMQTMSTTPQTNPPPWVELIVKTMSAIEAKITDLDKKISVVDEQVKKLDRVEKKMNTFDKKISDITSNLNRGFEETGRLIEELQSRSDGMEFGLDKLEEALSKVQLENKRLKDEMVDLKSRSMRDNLLFSNIPETTNETPRDTEKILRDFLKNTVKMDVNIVDNIQFDRVHRIGGSRSPRVIVAKFNQFQQRQLVREQSKNLRGTNFYINEQYPPEIVAERKELSRIMKRKREEGHNVRLVYNKLYVDNRLYRPDSDAQRNNAAK